MNRLQSLFERQKKDVLAIYYTAGYPRLEDTRRILLELDAAGVDLVEIGMPFSDPLADGPTIQSSSLQALQNGMNLSTLFDQLEGIREETDLPVVLMGYLNPVMVFGLESFCRRCRDVGVDGLILPDLPLWEYETQYREIFERFGLSMIFLVTPQTPTERIRLLDAASEGFLYAVSVSSTTGGSGRFGQEQEEYFQRLADMKLKNPVLVGFGISGPENFRIASRYLQGGVVGSAFIRALMDNTGIRRTVDGIRGTGDGGR